MATLLSIKRRIRAAQNVSKTTKAMQMIAASKLKKAQDATLASRPYVEKVSVLVADIADRIEQKEFHPYMNINSIAGKSLIIALSPDKGLCGGLITNLLREFFAASDANKNASYVVIGKKLEGQVTKLQNEVLATFHFGTTLPKFDVVFPLIKLIDEYYLSQKVDTVKVLYTDFTSIFSQTPKVVTLLPVTLPHSEPTDEKSDQNHFALFEPDVQSLLPDLLRHYLEMTIYQYFLESYVSEQASRMIAMQNATNNAKDIITELQLEYNKTRQSKITSELLDITGSKRAEGAQN
ncbi:MAG: ATP synthase F1 subunit gamma [Candidatus Levybacteria bacterium]|nr:ATP synthase F1 subunit gamma [Candidatus Levybacteria bacterium]